MKLVLPIVHNKKNNQMFIYLPRKKLGISAFEHPHEATLVIDRKDFKW